MKSPFTGKEMSLRSERKEVVFRKEPFVIIHHYYFCEDTGEEFTSDALDALNLSQVYNQYREKHHLPYPDQIRKTRKLYGLPATAMARVLGFGVNIYRNYENGEVPSESNARLIQLIRDPEEFMKLVVLSGAFHGKKLEKVMARLKEVKVEHRKNRFRKSIMTIFQGARQPDRYSGYRVPDLKRLTCLVLYFADRLQPYKTKLNKLLFYADFLHYSRYGYSISGTRYAAIDMGPVPNGFSGLFGWMEQEGLVKVKRTHFAHGGIGEQFVVGDGASFQEVFSTEEMETIKDVVRAFSETGTKEIIDLSHEEPAWIDRVGDKGLISYEYAFSLKAFSQSGF